MTGGGTSTALTEFQVVARLFFSLPAASGFLLTGGAALNAQRLTNRPTRAAAAERGWQVIGVQDAAAQFCRVVAGRRFSPVLR